MLRPRLRRVAFMADVNFVPLAIGAMRSQLANVSDLAPIEANRAHRAQCQLIREGVEAAAGTRGCGGHDALSWSDSVAGALRWLSCQPFRFGHPWPFRAHGVTATFERLVSDRWHGRGPRQRVRSIFRTQSHRNSRGVDGARLGGTAPGDCNTCRRTENVSVSLSLLIARELESGASRTSLSAIAVGRLAAQIQFKRRRAPFRIGESSGLGVAAEECM